MNGKDFKKEIATNPKNVYCLVSVDSAIVDLYVDRLKTAIGADFVSYGDIKSFGKLFNKKCLSVLYMPKINESIFECNTNLLVYTDKIDKRQAVYKQHKDNFIELKNNYIDFIMNHSDLSESEAKQFSKACNNDLGIIKNSLTIYNLSDLSYNRFTDYSNDVFLWVENFIKKQKLPKINESPIGVMALLSTNCTNLLRIKHNDTKGLNPFVVKCLYELRSYRSEEELTKIIGDCFYLDCQIKKGLFNIEHALKYLILKDYK